MSIADYRLSIKTFQRCKCSWLCSPLGCTDSLCTGLFQSPGRRSGKINPRKPSLSWETLRQGPASLKKESQYCARWQRDVTVVIPFNIYAFFFLVAAIETRTTKFEFITINLLKLFFLGQYAVSSDTGTHKSHHSEANWKHLLFSGQYYPKPLRSEAQFLNWGRLLQQTIEENIKNTQNKTPQPQEHC